MVTHGKLPPEMESTSASDLKIYNFKNARLLHIIPGGLTKGVKTIVFLYPKQKKDSLSHKCG